MDLETFERADVLKSVIDQASTQIKKLEELKNSHEIVVAMNSPVIKSALRGIPYNDLNPAPLYYTGGTKERIVDIMLERKIKFRDSRMEEFKKL